MRFSFGAFKSLAIAQLAPFVPSAIGQLSSVIGLGITLPGGPSSNNWNKVPVEITIKDAKNDTYIQIPVIPETIDYGDGNAISDTVKVLNLGNVDFHSGVELDTLIFSSFFPGRYDAGYCAMVNIKKPIEYRNWFSAWKDESLVLQVIIPAYDINKTMKVSSFTWKAQGFEGDIAYSVTFKEHKVVIPRQVETGGTLPEKGKKVPEERPAAAATAGG
ncbi:MULTISPECIES: hypothetical protein [Pelosinus]|uniref:Uncharacterized protein n=1 Tax=Pelosinus fermentans B4 TaxID=1149862 RepID=I9LHD2_9FIRM|nr:MULTISPECIES: hypothetical protein [Pelosinus]EIW19909.1 hypothetical protein FB4_0160 [Pelosinus fermentans B4]EIW21234.1 hypothetical protein FA11_0961 [Pelosinus fermentans A11]